MLFLSVGQSRNKYCNTEETTMCEPLHSAPWETRHWSVMETDFKEKHLYNMCISTATAKSRKHQEKDRDKALWEFRGGRDKFQLRDLWKNSDSG